MLKHQLILFFASQILKVTSQYNSVTLEQLKNSKADYDKKNSH